MSTKELSFTPAEIEERGRKVHTYVFDYCATRFDDQEAILEAALQIVHNFQEAKATKAASS